MGDLPAVAIAAELAVQENSLADPKALRQPAAVGAEENQLHRVVAGAGVHATGRSAAPRRCLVPLDLDQQRHHLSLDGVAQVGPGRRVDSASRQMGQKLDAAGIRPAQQACCRLGHGGTYPWQGGQRREQRVEERRPQVAGARLGRDRRFG